MHSTFVAEALLKAADTAVTGSLVDIQGEPFYRVANHDAMAPFLMSLVSDSDLWLFISSNGALSAGRKDPDHALFPYYTDDRIHDSQDQTGSRTLLRIVRDGRTSLWEPFSQRFDGLYRTARSLAKSVYGNRILFQEDNLDLGLSFRYEWMSSERFGFVRRAALVNLGADPVAVEMVDGIQNVLPWGIERRFQAEYSTLADGYKRTERIPGTALALFRMSSIPVDKPEPSEALRVNLAWCAGLEPDRLLLSTDQLGAFRRGEPLQDETDVRGRRGAYLMNAAFTLAPAAERDWLVVADLGQDAAQVIALRRQLLGAGLKDAVMEDVARGSAKLLRIVASSDGLQMTGDPLNTARHYSNTLFNVLRGGIPDDGYRISRADLKRFMGQCNKEVARSQGAFLDSLPETLGHGELLRRVARQEDPDLERLAQEYLPLTFSRRHGDPSRPWNGFSIEVKDEQGGKVLNYEGNWRDVFQNWEALGHSFPGFLESMIFKFADCSTLDGGNPYRLMRAGFDWEVSDPHDPWSFIGYWGDHQVIYLLKLLEASRQFHPGRLAGLLSRQVFTYANIPYRIKPYSAMLADPRSTIDFDTALHRQAMELAGALGADGLAVMGPEGPVRATLAEKLLLVALTKLTNYIPEAGIWMNTQRPEWNDANNALVGFGVSMVTLCYLHRYLAFCLELFEGAGTLSCAQEIAELLDGVAGVLERHAGMLERGVQPRERRQVLDALGAAGTRYRDQVYRGLGGGRRAVPAERARAFFRTALAHTGRTIQVNRRADGLYHSYNLMKLAGDGIEIRNLYEMLEGQVAVLSSGALTGEAAASLLDALRASALYRADQDSYVLYPDHPLPHFLEKNTFSIEAAQRSALLRAMLEAGDERILARDVEGRCHFNAALRSGKWLRQALEDLKEGPYAALAAQEEAQLLDFYEQVFDHQSFTGRSGTFYKYEGLGCIYWHMVSKLLLAVDEARQRNGAEDGATLARLEQHYQAIRAGLGVHKSPARHGAIPTDPYSHTPSFAGAQQPGMTGQVKEDILTRLSEMGVQVSGGRIHFRPWMVSQAEFLRRGAAFPYIDLEGRSGRLELDPGSFAFTLCQVPMVVHRGGAPGIRVTRADGATRSLDTLVLDVDASAAIFERSGAVLRLDVYLGLS